MGKLMTSFSLASIVGVPFGLMAANRFGWHFPFLALVVLGFVTMAVALKVIPNVNSHLRAHYSGLFSGLTENLKDKNSRRALFTTFTMVLSLYMVIPFISTYLVTNTGFPETSLPLVYLVGGLLTFFTGPIMGKICDRFTPQKVFKRTGLLYFVPVFLITHLGLTPVALTLFISTCFFIFSNARMVPAMTIISSSIPASRRGSFMSLNSCLQQLGSATASFLGGWVITQQLGSNQLQGFSYTAYFSIAFGLCAYVLGRNIRTVS
jgi:DHA1 family inner membrane transport protein